MAKTNLSGNLQVNTYTFTADGNLYYWLDFYGSSVETYNITNIQLETGSSATAYSPYSNICPISGHTGAEIQQTGKLLGEVDDTVSTTGSYSVSITNINYGRALINIVNSLKAGTYKYKIWFENLGDTASRQIVIRYTDNTEVAFPFYSNSASGSTESTVVIPKGLSDKTIRYTLAYFGDSSGTETVRTVGKLQIIKQTDTFEDGDSYTGNQISVTFPASAGDSGTVYGGMLTVNPDRTGDITVAKVKRLLNGDLSYSNFLERTKTCRMYLSVQSMKGYFGSDVNILADSLTVYRPDYVFNNDVEGLSQNNNANQAGIWICISKERLSAYSYAGMTEYVSTHPCEIIFELANYQTIPLTAAEVSGILSTFYGTNNFWSDVSDDITVNHWNRGFGN